MIGLKNAFERLGKDTKNVVSGEFGGAANKSRGKKRDPREWRERLKGASTGSGGLNEEETKEGMSEVERLLRISAGKGSGEAWTALGDLYLVSFERKTF